MTLRRTQQRHVSSRQPWSNRKLRQFWTSGTTLTRLMRPTWSCTLKRRPLSLPLLSPARLWVPFALLRPWPAQPLRLRLCRARLHGAPRVAHCTSAFRHRARRRL